MTLWQPPIAFCRLGLMPIEALPQTGLRSRIRMLVCVLLIPCAKVIWPSSFRVNEILADIQHPDFGSQGEAWSEPPEA